jgi:hypothetical protein
MTLSREELIQLQYMELQRIAHELFDAARFDRGDGKHFSKLLGGCWDSNDRSWDEWLECQSKSPCARQRFDELMGIERE